MDNVLIVVDDLEAAKAFFAELGMELEGKTTVEGEWADRVVGLKGVCSDIALHPFPLVKKKLPSYFILPHHCQTESDAKLVGRGT